MNCNEEFIMKAIGKLTLEFNFDWEQQRKIRECLNYSMYNYEVHTLEKSLIKGDMHEKIFLYIKVKQLAGYSNSTLKHYQYTLGLQNGANLVTIQHLLGHTDPATTQIYAENSLENIKHEYKQHMNS